MYEVPYNVKRALKVGNLRKNCKIQVYGIREPGLYLYGRIWLSSFNPDTSMNFYVEVSGEYIWGMWDETKPPINPPHPITISAYKIERGEDIIIGPIAIGTSVNLEAGDLVSVLNDESGGCLWFYEKNYTEMAGESFIIDNDNIIRETAKLDDRMCSGDTLQFGLCEGASFEFQYFDRPNINGHEIQVFLSVEYYDDGNELAWYDIPMGHFTVDECPMQFSTGIYKAVAYNKLMSKYLDQKANALLLENVADPTHAMSFGDIRHILLQNYEVKEEFQGEETLTEDDDIYVYRIGPATTLKARYGINTYFNYLWLARGALSYYYPMLICHHWRLDLETGKSYIIQLQRDVSAAEKHLFEFVRDIIQNAITATTVEAWLHSDYAAPTTAGINVAYKGWGSACYIGYYHSGVLDRYSTIGKKSNEAGVLGTFEDMTGRTIVGATGDYIEICWPMTVRMATNTSGAGEPIRADYHLSSIPQVEDDLDYHRYRYYADSSLSIDNAPWGWLDYRYPNGEETNLTNLVEGRPYPSGYYELLRVLTIDTTAADDVQIVPADLADITLREATSAVYELSAQFGQLDRVTDLFSGVELNGGGLFPAETLYPADGLYPNQGSGNNVIHPFPSEYQKLWTDTVGVQTFRYLIITYKGLIDDGQGNMQEADLILQRTVNADGTTDYNCSNNWLFRNMVWTEQQVGDFADAMVLKMKDIRWFPFEMWAAGLPYVDVGDAIEISDRQGNTYFSYILQRQLDGIHNLMDTYINGELDVF